MPARHQRLIDRASDELAAALTAIRQDLGLDAGFPAAAQAEAQAYAAAPRLPDADRMDIAFVTIDPAGSTDLDQALHLERDGAGFVVRHAIADVAAFVEPGGAIDAEARSRGQTMYAPDGRVPLHPPVVSEGAASLLEGQERAAYVWTMRLDASGDVTGTALERARVRSREQLTYRQAQARIDAGDAMLGLLREAGELRIALEEARDGASLDMPEEEIVRDGDDYRLERRELLPVERWNAQVSLMTGMEAAALMLRAGRGILRTMPVPPAPDVRRFRAEVRAIGEEWAEGEHYGAFLRRLDRSKPTTLAILQAARRLFRGAGYTVLDGTAVLDEGADASALVQAAIGAPYAHTTAPLRRLVDRYVLAHCEAIANGRDIPAWASDGLEGLPEIMPESGRIAGRLERESSAGRTTRSCSCSTRQRKRRARRRRSRASASARAWSRPTWRRGACGSPTPATSRAATPARPPRGACDRGPPRPRTPPRPPPAARRGRAGAPRRASARSTPRSRGAHRG